MAGISISDIARRGFGRLFDARGRDSRTQFWIFGALVFAPLILVQVAAQIVLTFPSFKEMAALAPGERLAGAKMFETQMQGLVTSAYVNIGLYLVASILLLAAAARRLHDRGRRGWWALILPLGLFAAGLGQAEQVAGAVKRMPAMLAKMESQSAPDPGAMFDWVVKANAPSDGPNWLALAGALLLLGLLVELARAGTGRPDRFGPAPE